MVNRASAVVSHGWVMFKSDIDRLGTVFITHPPFLFYKLAGIEYNMENASIKKNTFIGINLIFDITSVSVDQ